jgi:hypothetical protein
MMTNLWGWATNVCWEPLLRVVALVAERGDRIEPKYLRPICLKHEPITEIRDLMEPRCQNLACRPRKLLRISAMPSD